MSYRVLYLCSSPWVRIYDASWETSRSIYKSTRQSVDSKKLVDKEAPNHGFLIFVIKFSCETNFTREGTCQSWSTYNSACDHPRNFLASNIQTSCSLILPLLITILDAILTLLLLYRIFILRTKFTKRGEIKRLTAHEILVTLTEKWIRKRRIVHECSPPN